mmetsp:Transcript_5978/g.37075  ORF Transcript_5978/g.37075 Transcript_5978/m.37075 type:complete len:201 (-) Transcript_5978:226-828(-)
MESPSFFFVERHEGDFFVEHFGFFHQVRHGTFHLFPLFQFSIPDGEDFVQFLLALGDFTVEAYHVHECCTYGIEASHVFHRTVRTPVVGFCFCMFPSSHFHVGQPHVRCFEFFVGTHWFLSFFEEVSVQHERLFDCPPAHCFGELDPFLVFHVLQDGRQAEQVGAGFSHAVATIAFGRFSHHVRPLLRPFDGRQLLRLGF